MGIMFGGDAENFMEAPRMENKSLSESLGVNPVAAFLDLIGVHRQVARGPKPTEEAKGEKVFTPQITSPSVLTEVQSALATPPAPITPVTTDSAITPWGQRWLDSNKPLLSVDPDDFLR